MKKFIIDSDDYINLRLDKWLKKNFSSLSQSFIEKNIRKGNIKVNLLKKKSNYKLKRKDQIIIYNYSLEGYSNIKIKKSEKVISSKYLKLFESSKVYENNDFIILNKWTGIATQGGSKINISIDEIIKSISDKYNLVHRLDRETSGLLIISKNYSSTKVFGKLFKERLVEKIYIAICQGNPKNKESLVNLSVKDKKDETRSLDTLTSYKVIETQNKLSNIIFFPKTGRTHQIRIVAKHIGTPIIGDTKYNRQDKYKFEKLKLNAYFLKFIFNENKYEFFSELPNHFNEFLKKNNFKKIDIKKVL